PDRARIFEAFYRAAGSAPDAAARAGLGLSIARTLAHIQGGSVNYSPRSGGGAVFELRFPASELRARALEAIEQPAWVAVRPGTRGSAPCWPHLAHFSSLRRARHRSAPVVRGGSRDLGRRRMELREQLQNLLGGSYRIERELGGGGMSRVF